MEYVPQVWGKGHLHWVNGTFPNLNTSLLRESNCIMAFNEPDQFAQSHVQPGDAAGLWPNMTWIAKEYNIKLIAPCVSNVHGAKWWLDAFDKNCTARYGQKCEFDYPCTHAYYFPEPCGGLPAWACAASMMKDLQSLSKRYDNKPVWITEWCGQLSTSCRTCSKITARPYRACPAWIGGTFAKNSVPVQYCDAANQLKTMQQMLPKLDAAEYVHRYSWYLLPLRLLLDLLAALTEICIPYTVFGGPMFFVFLDMSAARSYSGSGQVYEQGRRPRVQRRPRQ